MLGTGLWHGSLLGLPYVSSTRGPILRTATLTFFLFFFLAPTPTGALTLSGQRLTPVVATGTILYVWART
jgi:hypothetical protein